MGEVKEYVEAVCLLKLPSPDICTYIGSKPDSFVMNPGCEYITFNTVHHYSTKKMVYSYTIPSFYCYSLLFPFNGECYAIVIVSKLCIPQLFIQFLLHSNDEFNHSPEHISPENRADYVYAVIKSWKASPPQKGSTVLSSNRNYTLTRDYFCFTSFDPFLYFSQISDIFIAWRALIRGRPVIVIANDVATLTNAVYSVASLLSPIPYRGTFLITSSFFDERLKHADEFGIIGVTPDVIDGLEFDLTEIVPNVIKANNTSNFSDEREKMRQRATKFQSILIFLLDRMLVINPFNDFFEGPFINDGLESELKDRKTSLKADDFRLFEKTPSCAAYRKQKRMRSAFRNALLSADPATVIGGLTISHREGLLPILAEVREKFKDDNHVIAVVRRYKKILAEYK